jgi:hypothetical protein
LCGDRLREKLVGRTADDVRRQVVISGRARGCRWLNNTRNLLGFGRSRRC